MATIKDLQREIKRQYRAIKEGKQLGFNFLGYVENKDLSPEVENLFSFENMFGSRAGYNWISGNKRLKELIKQTIK